MKVTIVEEGPREGFQSEPPGIAAVDKLALIHALAGTGLAEINTCSFVSPAQVPQMADAQEIAAGLRPVAGVTYTGLWLNAAGFERARAAGLDRRPALVTSVSETFGLKNNRRDRAGLLAAQADLAGAYVQAGHTRVSGYVFTAFGCNYEGDVPVAQVVSSVADLLRLAETAGLGVTHVYLCDTIGAAAPHHVEAAIGAVRARWPDLELALHLHDTRGLGLANALTGLRLGVRRFDASVGGLGGCPFAGNRAAAGNICTEDFAYLCEEEGFATGLNLDALIEVARLAERVVGHPLPGKLMKARRFARAGV